MFNLDKYNPLNWIFGNKNNPVQGEANRAVRNYAENTLETRAQGGDVDWVPGVSVIGGDRNPQSGWIGPTAQPTGTTQTPIGETSTTTITDNSAQATAQAEARRQAAIRAQADPLQQALAALDETLGNRLGQVRGEFDQNMARYNEAEAQDRTRYGENVATNEGQLMSQRQNKLVAGARLGKNLQAILGSMGALNGTGMFLGNEAVRGITNAGLGEASDTFNTNAKLINDNWSTAEQGHRQRKEDAESIRAAAEANTRADVMSNRQQILNQLANIFGADTAEGANYLGEAGRLYGEIAKTTRPNVPAYQKASTLFSPGALQQYLSGIGNTQVTTAPGAETGVPINSPLFAGNRRREERLI